MFKIILTIGTIQTLAVFVLFIKSKIVAVYLGPAGVGVVGTIDQFVQFASFISVFGFPAASIKFLSKAHSEGKDAFRRSYAGFFKLLFSLSSAGAILIIAIILLKPDILGAELEKYKLFLLLGLLTLPTFTLTGLFGNVFAASQKFRASSLLILITNLVSMTAAVVGVIYANMFGLYVGNILAGILMTITVMIYFRQKLELPFCDRQTNVLTEFKSNPAISSTAFLLYFSAVTASLSYLTARYSVVTNFGEIEAGLLHGAMVLSFAFGTALYPAINIYLNPLVNRNEEREIKIKQAVQFLRKMALILSIAALPILMFPKLMLTILFTKDFAAAGQFVYLFVMSQFIVQLAGVFQSLLVGLDDVKSYTLITSGGQIISICMCLLLVPHFGIEGAAFGFLIGNSLNFICCLIRLIVKYNFSFSRQVGFLIGYTSVMLFIIGLANNQFAELNGIVISVKILFLLLFGASLFLFLNQEEKQYINFLCRKIYWRKH